ncbi:MAG: hypothetical protein K0R80_2887 [Clostridia bacterium]|jgi:hypothetical protein|nr:hypothetical protein [Clostridia bacterium]
MRKFRFKNRTSISYILAFVLGLLILPIAVKVAFVERGYHAAGGELLLPILFALLVALKSEIKEVVDEVKGAWM